jgi:polyisoprenoid-binding protein YceI
MKCLRLLLLALFVPLAVRAAEHPLKADPAGTFLDVDVDATINFTSHLDAYDARLSVDDTGKIKSATFAFKFADLKSGKPDRDAEMIKWLGGGSPEGRFEMGNLAQVPDGQGQVSGRLTFHGVTQRVEFPINIARVNGTYVVTGETTIDYRDWNLKIIRKAFLFSVSPMVKVRFKLTAVPVTEAAR